MAVVRISRAALLAFCVLLLGAPHAFGLMADGNTPAFEAAEIQDWPGTEHGGAYAYWEYPDFAWSDEEADLFAQWIPSSLTSVEPVTLLDWSLAEENPDARTATSRTYTMFDTDWSVTRTWAAPVNWRDHLGVWREIIVEPEPTENALYPLRVTEHRTTIEFPAVLGQASLAIGFRDLSQPLEIGRELYGADTVPLAGAPVTHDGPRLSFHGDAASLAIEVTGFGLIQALVQNDGSPLTERRFSQSLTLPVGLAAKIVDNQLHLTDDTGQLRATATARALLMDGEGGMGGLVDITEVYGALRLSVSAPSRGGDVQALILIWRLESDGIRDTFGSLFEHNPNGTELAGSCATCGYADGHRGVWFEFDFAGGDFARGVQHAWLDTAAVERSTSRAAFQWERPEAKRSAIHYDAFTENAWRLPEAGAFDSPPTADFTVVSSGRWLDNGLAKAVSATDRGVLYLATEAPDLLSDPFVSARLAKVNVSVSHSLAETYPYTNPEFTGDCFGHTCWTEVGWTAHGAHAASPLFARNNDGLTVNIPTSSSCPEAFEELDSWLASPWVEVQENAEGKAVRWMDDIALTGDWASIGAKLVLQYRLRQLDWSVSEWHTISNGATHKGSADFEAGDPSVRDVISWEAGQLGSSVRDVQMRYRVVGKVCGSLLQGDPLADLKEAGAKVSTAWWGGCNGYCTSGGIQCGNCVCAYGGCHIFNSSPTSCWTCGGSSTNTGNCRIGTRYCQGGRWSGCYNQTCPTSEVCNGSDDDCDGQVDEQGAGGCTWYYYDYDGDGWGQSSAKCLCSPQGRWRATKPGDCQDYISWIYPGAPESCNGWDNNCNGAVDDGSWVPGCTTYYYDGDGDGYGRGWQSTCRCKASGGYTSTNGSDCNDSNYYVSPAQPERCWTGYDDNCNNATNEHNAWGCSTYYWDADNDGWGTNAGLCFCSPSGAWRATRRTDCNDGNSSIYPGAKEKCNGVDDNCKGGVDEGQGYSTCGQGQCYHSQPNCVGGVWQSCNPYAGATGESCDGKDNDCDGAFDENWALGAACDGADADQCAEGTYACNGSGGVWCTDTTGSTYETCDNSDNDCDGLKDEGYNYWDPVHNHPRGVGQSCFGYGACGAGTVECAGAYGASCSTNPGQSNSKASAEVCNSKDDDCDGQTDEGLVQGCYTGPGGTNGVGVCHGGTRSCSNGNWATCQNQVTPAPSDTTCNGKDNDCDGQIDEDYAPVTCGVGECVRSSSCNGGNYQACIPGTPTPDDQCDGKDQDCDGETDEHCCTKTMAVEQNNCDGIDNDCDGLVDENYDDGIACTTSSCVNGVASNVPNDSACNDNEPCTDDACVVGYGCANAADDSNAPDSSKADNSPCTTLTCSGGTSKNLPDNSLVPDDGLSCTADSCVAGEARHDLIGGNCLVGGSCYGAGEASPGNNCQVCYPDYSTGGFSKYLYKHAFDGNAAGWTLEDVSGSGVNWQPSSSRSHAGSGSLYMGNPATKTYQGNGRVIAQATSPSIWLPSGVVTLLDFQLWLETEAFNQAVSFDVLFIDVVTGSGATTVWNSVEELAGSTGGGQAFRHITLDLGDYAGQSVQIRWRFDSGDGNYNAFEGAYLDTVELRTACCANNSDCDDGDSNCTIDSCVAGVCNHTHVCDNCSPTATNLLVLLDYSSSMNSPPNGATAQSKWEGVKSGLAGALATYGPVVNTAVKLFKTPGQGHCSASNDSLQVAFHASGSQIGGYLGSMVPGGLSPMASGLNGALAAYGASGLSGERLVLLITDGVDDCGGDAEAAVDKLRANGIDVFVLGVGQTGAHDELNALAELGGRGRTITSSTEASYYQATTPQSIAESIMAIFAEATAEKCNGVDDDCDGQTDEGVPPVSCNVSCGFWGAAGERTCSNGEWGSCSVSPSAELCNGLDDDCNQTIDDAWTDNAGNRLGDSCSVGVGACRREGVFVCAADQMGEPVCDATPGTPVAETCDNIDNDCDGMVDDGLTRDCSTACGAGNEVCVSGNWVNCDAPPVLPDNQCDYVDNDCDGVTDPLFPEINQDCDGADSDQCAYGFWTCRSTYDAAECVNEDPANVQETCDGNADEDCDGIVDEEDAVGCVNYWYDGDGDGYGGAGPRCLCAPIDKWNSSLSGDCDDQNAAAFPGNDEVCDNVDNDCDSITDERADDPNAPLDRSCYSGPAGTLNVGVCQAGTEFCYSGVWSACQGQILPSVEVCNGQDDDCDAVLDPKEPDTTNGESADDHPCATDPNCALGDCYCMENDQTGGWSCILE